MLRDTLLCGVNHDHTQQKLLHEDTDLTLQKVSDILLSLEFTVK